MTVSRYYSCCCISIAATTTRIRLTQASTVSLPADFTVWAASEKAKTLGSGKFVWAHWDVDELEKLAKEGAFQGFVTKIGLPVPSAAQFGLVGWPSVKA